jgi:hypothetical protein
MTSMILGGRPRRREAAFFAAHLRSCSSPPVNGGVSNPPLLRPVLSRGRPRGFAHAPVSVSRSFAECSSDLRAVCTCVVMGVHAADHTGIALHFQHTSAKVLRAASAITSSASSCARSRQGSSLRSDPLCGPAGLDDTCAQLEGSTYVMAEEARRVSVLTRPASRRMVKISSVPSRTLSAVASDAERCNHRSQS